MKTLMFYVLGLIVGCTMSYFIGQNNCPECAFRQAGFPVDGDPMVHLYIDCNEVFCDQAFHDGIGSGFVVGGGIVSPEFTVLVRGISFGEKFIGVSEERWTEIMDWKVEE